MPLVPYDFKHLNRILREEKITKPAKHILTLFYCMKNKTNSCFPSYKTISELTGTASFTTISKAIKELEENELITVVRERKTNSKVNKANRYTLAYKWRV